MRTGLEPSAQRFTQRHCGEVTRPIMSPQGEGRGSPSQTLRASVPLDSGPCALWHCLYLALVIHSSSVILLSTRLCHLPNQIRNGLWLRLCFYTPLRVFCGWRGTYNPIPEPWIFWTRQEEKHLNIGSLCYGERLPERHSLNTNVLKFLRF